MNFDNIPKDEMTPIERSKAIKTGLPYDRIPCSPMVAEQVVQVTGITVRDYLFKPKLAAEAVAKSFERYGYDSVSVSPDHHGFSEAMGVKFIFPEYDRPIMEEIFLKEKADISKLKPADPYKDGRLPLVLQAVEHLQELVGDKVKVGSGCGGPLTCASFLRGADNLLRDMRKDPEFIHKIMECTTQSIINYMAAAWKLGVGCSVGDSFSSCTLISPNYFRTYVKPYLKRIADWQRENIGSVGNLHICGETRAIWQDMLELGFGSISLDNRMSMKEAKAVLGPHVALKGNVKPVETMLYGTVEEVYAECKQCIEDTMDSPKGYNLSSGCTLPVQTPPENLKAMVDSARIWGRYKGTKSTL
ncbi:MAG: uroporphyrinogen decarboxylase family protein [Clostridia bacterium]|nr:uroporphyrinogen decarboxylase family protein [Clostridia bacterium]MDD4571969.1 uroporphyrinogen decarboxylase family protein [Clostridia bacterium]